MFVVKKKEFKKTKDGVGGRKYWAGLNQKVFQNKKGEQRTKVKLESQWGGEEKYGGKTDQGNCGTWGSKKKKKFGQSEEEW